MKHNNSMSELGEQIDNLNSSKMKGEKDKTNLERDLGDARASLEETIKGKSEVDKQAKLINGSIGKYFLFSKNISVSNTEILHSGRQQ